MRIPIIYYNSFYFIPDAQTFKLYLNIERYATRNAHNISLVAAKSAKKSFYIFML